MTETALVRRRWLLPSSLRGLAITFACLSALVTTILGMTTFVVVHHEIERQIDHRITIETNGLLDYEKSYGLNAMLAAVAIHEGRSLADGPGYLSAPKEQLGRDMGYIVLDADGKRRGGMLNAKIPPPGWSEFVKFTRADGSQGVAQALNSPLPDGGRLIVAGDRAMLLSMDRLLLCLFGTAFGTLFVLGGVMVILFGWIVRRRLITIENSANSIIAGNMSKRIPLDGFAVELDRLSTVLNHMLDRICLLVENVRSVSNGIAHDLRTPLSKLRARLERAADLSKDPQQRELLEAAIDESDQLLDLFSGLLAIAEIDGQSVRKRFQNLDLADAVSEIAEAHRPALEDIGISLSVDLTPASVCGDKALLQRMVGNLLDNVIIHAASANQVNISLTRQAGSAIVRISDNGPGIPPAEHDRVFQRLVRLDAARSLPGHGLGLSLIATIAAAHYGQVQLLPADVGTTVEFSMPLANTDLLKS